MDVITAGLSRVNVSPFNKVFPPPANFVKAKLVSCLAYEEAYHRRLLPYHTAAVLWHGTGFLPGTDAAALGSCSRLQDRDAAAELTVKRQVFHIRARVSRRKFTAECIIGFPSSPLRVIFFHIFSFFFFEQNMIDSYT